jgi:glycosyltransferase involved in cell wall biosynthesis
MPACAHVFVQSEQMRADLTREGIPAHKMTAVPSSINLAELDAGLNTRADVEAALAGRACEAIPDPDASLVAGPPPAPGVAARAEPVSTDAHTIVYLGTLLRERKLDFLVAVLANVRRRVPDARLVFIGRGEMPEDEDLLLGEAERLGVADAVRITGWLPMQIAWQHVRGAGACVSPYYPVPILLSTSPTKLIEYMALGKAVVANDHPEQSLVLRRSGAGLLCGWDADEFADAIVLLLKHPSVAESMGRAGRRFVEAHRTHSTMVGLVASRYYDVLGTFAERKRTAKAAVPADGSGWLRKASRKEHLGKAE